MVDVVSWGAPSKPVATVLQPPRLRKGWRRGYYLQGRAGPRYTTDLPLLQEVRDAATNDADRGYRCERKRQQCR